LYTLCWLNIPEHCSQRITTLISRIAVLSCSRKESTIGKSFVLSTWRQWLCRHRRQHFSTSFPVLCTREFNVSLHWVRGYRQNYSNHALHHSTSAKSKLTYSEQSSSSRSLPFRRLRFRRAYGDYPRVHIVCLAPVYAVYGVYMNRNACTNIILFYSPFNDSQRIPLGTRANFIITSRLQRRQRNNGLRNMTRASPAKTNNA
jgi:hypothetical protein